MLTVTSEHRIADDQVYIENTLHEIHKNIYDLSWSENFKEGWKEFSKSENSCTEVAYKVYASVSGILITFFSGSSIAFGVLALRQGIEDIKNYGKAPVIGHFSEWSIQGAFSLSLYAKFLNEIRLLGEQKKAHEIFLSYLNKEDPNSERQCTLYKEYLEFLRNRPSTAWITLPGLPKPPENSLPSDNIVGWDSELKEDYEELEKVFSDFSYLQQMQEGWKIIASQKSSAKRALIKTLIVAGGVWAAINLLNYPLGIFWSGERAYEDFKNGDNPSIGGHCLEWSAECIAMINAVFYFSSEIANVGKSKMIVDLFQRKMDALNLETISFAAKKRERLVEEMRKTIGKIQQGIFFKIPSWLAFRKSE